jgi:hypothetical protein
MVSRLLMVTGMQGLYSYKMPTIDSPSNSFSHIWGIFGDLAQEYSCVLGLMAGSLRRTGKQPILEGFLDRSNPLMVSFKLVSCNL